MTERDDKPMIELTTVDGTITPTVAEAIAVSASQQMDHLANLNPFDKARIVAQCGFVYITDLDERKRVKRCITIARGLEFASVEYARKPGVIQIVSCRHTHFFDSTRNHVCEAHRYGLVCYHALAGLLTAAQMQEMNLLFYNDFHEAMSVSKGHKPVAVYVSQRRPRVYVVSQPLQSVTIPTGPELA